MGSSDGPWAHGVVAGVAEVLGDTEDGLTGTQISGLLSRLEMDDPLPSSSKRARLEAAFVAFQDRTGTSRRLVTFITHAMEPVQYRDRPDRFNLRQDRLNERLAFVGLRVNDEGKIARGAAATTLDEASRVATSIREELKRRRTHEQVMTYCSVEVLKKDNFHAMFEASKSVFQRLRDLSGAVGDGAALVDATLAPGRSGQPLIALNDLATKTDHDEQTGFVNLLKGINGMFRNPVAHDPRLGRAVSDDELLEFITLLSMAHRRLDSITFHPR